MSFPRPLTPPNSDRARTGATTPPDQEMSAPQPSPRPSLLPSSLGDFGLFPSTSASAPSSPSTTLMTIDDPNVSMTNPSPFASPSTAWNYAFNYQAAGPVAATLFRKPRRPSTLGLGIIRGSSTTEPNTLASFLTPPSSSGQGIASTSRTFSPLVSTFASPSPFAFQVPPLGSYNASTSRGRGRDQADVDEYAPELLYANTSSLNSALEDDAEGSLPRTRTSTPGRTRISRSLSPTTPLQPDAGDPMTESLLNNTSSRLRRASATMLRQTSMAGSSSSSSTSSTAAMPIPNVSRRLALPRLQSLISESDLTGTEVKAEAAFQRFVSSHAEVPTPFRSYPRSRSRHGPASALSQKASLYPDERGRFPEEARTGDGDGDGDDDDGSSDDHPEDSAGGAMSLTEESLLDGSTGASKPSLLTAASGSSGSLGLGLESPAGMDLDMVNSFPAFSFGNSPISAPSAWRHTPPPSSSVSRVTKRKLDDRYDPYPSAKRRAVSPAISLTNHRTGEPFALASPIALPRSPITVSRGTPSTASSPILRPVVRLSERYMNMSGLGIGGGSAMGIGLQLGTGTGSGSWNNSATGLMGTNGNAKDAKELNGAGDGLGSLSL